MMNGEMTNTKDNEHPACGCNSETPEEVRPVPDLTEEDVKALQYLGTSGNFTLEKTAPMWSSWQSCSTASGDDKHKR